MQVEPRYTNLPHGITCIDVMLYRPDMVACYLIEEDGMAGFIDTGVGNSVPMLLEVLRRKRIAKEEVAFVMPTHVHLDHAGGAGRLMQELPNAKLLIHPRGARHMIDPSRLQAGSMAVYGEQHYKKIFGELIAVDENRIIEMEDNREIDFNGRKLVFYNTPGHARHHYCIFDETSAGLFTGDTFGASYAELNYGRKPFIFPPSTPVQFDPSAWKATLERLMTLQPKRIFITHFGMHDNVELLVQLLTQAIDEYAAIAQEYRGAPDAQQKIAEAIMQFSLNYLLDNECGLSSELIRPLLKMDMELNAQGLAHWLTTS